jgi:hypothetical protein
MSKEIDKKKKKVNFPVSIDIDFFQVLNDYCQKTGVNRSRLTKIALEKELIERKVIGC